MMLLPPDLSQAREAQQRIRNVAVRTPLVRLVAPDVTSRDIHLKLENLQPIGSFKLRGAANAMAMVPDDQLRRGVLTASAGNMAQGVAWGARDRGVPCTVVVPEHAPNAKTDAIERLGGSIVRVPFDRWWQTMSDRSFPGVDGLFIHPFADSAVMAGNGTIALEIFEELQDVDVILVPYGGGGLACGIAAVARELSPRTRVYAVEVETATPLSAALDAHAPVPVEYVRTFVDGIGSGGVATDMWPLAQSLLAGTIVVSLEDVARAVKLLVERAHTVAEGAGATSVAAALAASERVDFDGRRIVCIVSGGNIDSQRLATILNGQVPA